MQFPFQGLKVCFRHYDVAPADILFNGEPLATDVVSVIMVDNTLDRDNPISTFLGYVDGSFQSPEDVSLTFASSYQDNFHFISSLNYTDVTSLQFENEFRLENGATLTSGVSFVLEPSASTFLNIIRNPIVATTPFNFLDLNGNCGTLKNGTIVTVTDKEGEYIVRSSQIFWNDITSDSNMIIYYLEQDGCFMNAPSCYVTKKKVV